MAEQKNSTISADAYSGKKDTFNKVSVCQQWKAILSQNSYRGYVVPKKYQPKQSILNKTKSIKIFSFVSP